MTVEKHPFLIGDTSSNGCFSIVMLIFQGVYFEVYKYIPDTEQFSMSPQPGVFRPLSSLNQNPNGFLSPGSVVGSSVRLVVPAVPHQVTLEIHESFDTHFSNESGKMLR